MTMTNQKPFIAGNWKMYKTSSEAVETAGKLVNLVADTVDIFNGKIEEIKIGKIGKTIVMIVVVYCISIIGVYQAYQNFTVNLI